MGKESEPDNADVGLGSLRLCLVHLFPKGVLRRLKISNTGSKDLNEVDKPRPDELEVVVVSVIVRAEVLSVVKGAAESLVHEEE